MTRMRAVPTRLGHIEAVLAELHQHALSANLSLGCIENSLRQITTTQERHGRMIIHLMERTRTMATQEQVDALAAQLGDFAAGLSSALDGIQSDIDDLKAEHPDVDLSAIEEKVAALTPLAERAAAIDAENPAAAPEPTPEPAPPSDGPTL